MKSKNKAEFPGFELYSYFYFFFSSLSLVGGLHHKPQHSVVLVATSRLLYYYYYYYYYDLLIILLYFFLSFFLSWFVYFFFSLLTFFHDLSKTLSTHRMYQQKITKLQKDTIRWLLDNKWKEFTSLVKSLLLLLEIVFLLLVYWKYIQQHHAP